MALTTPAALLEHPAASATLLSVPLTATAKVSELIERLASMPAQSSVALQAMRLADDPNTDAARLGHCVEADPVFVAKLMRLANSAYYGMASHVSTCKVAIGVIGFSSVRSIAALMASGVSGGRAPDGFWEHAAQVAVASALLAPRVGAKAPEAFSAGLLHDIGQALLYQCDPAAFAWSEHQEDRLAAEKAVFGISHTKVAFEVLSAWHLPTGLLDAIDRHHIPPSRLTGLSKAVALGDALVAGENDLLGEVGIDDDAATQMLDVVVRDAAAMANFAN